MNRLYRIYYALPDFSRIGVVGKVINRLLGMILKRLFDEFVPRYFSKTSTREGFGLNSLPRETKYIVSLTSFPARIDNIWITIETILRQSFKPDAIVLWLAESQFPNKDLPKSLLELVERGLTIEFCEGDLRSHKKYIYAFDRNPEDFIITLDDDLYYDKDLLRNLVELKNQFPKAIATNRAHKILFKEGRVLPYRKWQHNVIDNVPSYSLVQTGGFGTIYKRDDLYLDFNNPKLIKDLAFHADDLWLKMMTYLKGKQIVTNAKYNKDPITVKNSQMEKLVNINVIDGGNDKQLKKIFDYYKIKEESFHYFLNKK
jgi:hypothetical protein